MYGITDMHCHILPGLDDGAKTMEETMAVLVEAERQHIVRMIATPHFHPGRHSASGRQVLRTLNRVRRCADNLGISVELLPGQECFYYTGLVEELDKGNALTLAGSRYVLVEFDPDCIYSYLTRGLQELQDNGYMPILAHYERYYCLSGQDSLRRLKDKGILLQLNFDTLTRRRGPFHKNQWKADAREGLIDYFGSDCHGTEFRPLHITEACAWINRNLSGEQQERILNRNIQNIINMN
ncbi:MAG: hypothetical protein Q4C91_10145 [Eubacteriales bacterium]|nr:hypothetical protein [Eubacteriales bacterium]